MQLADDCSIGPGVNVNVIGSPDDPDVQVQTLDGLTSCGLAVSVHADNTGCVLDPRAGVCDVRYDTQPLAQP